MRRFKTCGCAKDELRCVKTGFDFEYEGVELHGDLFLCRYHGALHIDGFRLWAPLKKDDYVLRKGLSLFTGNIARREHKSEWYMSLNGVVSLNPSDCAYIEKWQSLPPEMVDER